MDRNTVEILEKYIAGKDLDQAEILEHIYLENAEVLFEIKSETISFPDKIRGNKEIARILSADFNNKFDRVKTYYLSHHFDDIANLVINNQSWLVVMREKASNTVRVGAGYYDWAFEKLSNLELKIKKHKIFIGVMLEWKVPLETFYDLQNTLEYPWIEKERVLHVLADFKGLEKLTNYLRN